MKTGKRIQQAREQKNMTQEELAKRAKISRSALANYESGIREPKGEILVRIAEALEVSIDWLLYRTDDSTPPKFSKDEKSVPNAVPDFSWWYRDTPPTDVELEEFLQKANIYFDGTPLDEEDKEDIITYLKVKWEREKRKREKESKDKQKGGM